MMHFRAVLGLLALSLVSPYVLPAAISGHVRIAGTLPPGTPIAGAYVNVQADLVTPGAFTAADGSFTLANVPAGLLTLAANVPYSPGAAENFLTGGVSAADGDNGVEIFLTPLPVTDNPAYEPVTAEACGACHFERYTQWQSSHHANAGLDAWVLDVFSGTGTPGGGAGYVYRALHDPGETGNCAVCHAPMIDIQTPGQVMLDEVTDPAGTQGITCITCHQLTAVDAGNLGGLHYLGGKSTYRFPTPEQGYGTDQYVWGPMGDVTFEYMRASHSPLHRDSLLCAACHQYDRPENGQPGQHTYTEWLASPYAVPGPGYRTCQNCHMPELAGVGTNCSFGGPLRQGLERHAHTFVGSTPEMLQANLALTTTVEQTGHGTVRVRSSIDNFGAGHDFPTGVSIRNALLWITATLDGAPLVQVAGPTIPFWADDDVPGKQPGDLAGEPGKGIAKIQEGRINDQGPVVSPVLFVDAEAVVSNTQIPSGTIDTTEVEFALPAGTPFEGQVEVNAVLLYRRAWRALYVVKGWTEGPHGEPLETEVARNVERLTVAGAGAIEIPTLAPWGLGALAAALALAGARRLRRRAA